MFAKIACLLFLVGVVAQAGAVVSMPPGTFKTCGQMMDFVVRKTRTPMKCVVATMKECCDVCTYEQSTPTCQRCLESSTRSKMMQLYKLGCMASGRRLRSKKRTFIEAAKYNDAGRVGNLIRLGANVNQVDNNGKTALHWAAVYGWIDVVEKLLFHYMSKGEIKYDVRDDFGWTPLNLVARCVENEEDCSDNAQIMKYLLRKNVNVNTKNVKGWTPLARAAKYGFEEGVRMLLAHPNIEVNYGVGDKNPLYLAIENGHFRIADMIRRAGGKESSRRRLFYASGFGGGCRKTGNMYVKGVNCGRRTGMVSFYGCSDNQCRYCTKNTNDLERLSDSFLAKIGC